MAAVVAAASPIAAHRSSPIHRVEPSSTSSSPVPMRERTRVGSTGSWDAGSPSLRPAPSRRRRPSHGSPLAPLTSLALVNAHAEPVHAAPLSESPAPAETPAPKPVLTRELSPDAPAVKLQVELIRCRGLNVHTDSPDSLFVILAVNSTVSRSGPPVRYDAPTVLAGPADGSGPVAARRLNPVFEHRAEFDIAADSAVEVFLSVYDRFDGDQRHASGLVGTASIKLGASRRASADFHTLDLFDREGGRVDGTVSLHVARTVEKRKKLTPADFEILARIGEGSYGKVYKVRKIDTERTYAMKVLKKSKVRKSRTIGHVNDERKVLERARSLNSPFLVGLKFSFQTDSHLYLVMDLKSGGELFKHLQREGGHFVEERARFYLAEIVLGIDALHSRRCIYRDLKPENILLDETGHLALCDFGLSKPLETDEPTRTNTFCGTSDYLSPEMIKDEGASYAADWWAFGVLAYEMCFGYTPFYHENRVEKFNLIVNGTIRIPRRGISSEFRDMLVHLLVRDPAQRLGGKGVEEIKRHAFFASMDWDALAQRRLEPPFKPESDTDTPALSPSALSSAATTPERILKPSGPTMVSRRSSCEVPVADGADAFADDLADPPDWSNFSFYASDRGSGSITRASAHGSFSSVRGSFAAGRSSLNRMVSLARRKLAMTPGA